VSAFICDLRTIDYLVAYARRKRDLRPVLDTPQRDALPPTLRLLASPIVITDTSPVRCYHWPVDDADATGRLLLAENIRSVRYRYPDDAPDELPGPVPTPQADAYTFNPRGLPAELDPAWVIRAADCLRYQSCETPDWPETAACTILEAIREAAIGALVARAGASEVWEIRNDTLKALADQHRARRAEIFQQVKEATP
jgi:hypothetical protein